jgi:hypothetical protein
LQIKSDEPLETADSLTSQNDVDTPKRSSCSSALVQVDSYASKEEGKFPNRMSASI